MECTDSNDNARKQYRGAVVGMLYSLEEKQRLLGYPPHLTPTEVIRAEFLRRARLGEMFQDPTDLRQLRRRIRKVGRSEDWQWFQETFKQHDENTTTTNNNNNTNNSEDNETPATETSTTATTGTTTSTDTENCRKRTVMDCNDIVNNNDDDNQEVNDNNDDAYINKNNNTNNSKMISPSPKRIRMWTAVREVARENNAMPETTPTTTPCGARTTKPNEPSLVNVVRHSRPELFGHCVGVVAHPNRVEMARADPWMPIHTIYQWRDSDLRERVTILVVLPTGVNTRYTVAVRDRNMLEIVVQWPEMLLGNANPLDALFQKKMAMERDKNNCSEGIHGTHIDHMMKDQGFRLRMQCLKRQMEDRLESKAEISLPRAVHAHNMEINAVGSRDDGTRMLDITLFCDCGEINWHQGPAFVLV